MYVKQIRLCASIYELQIRRTAVSSGCSAGDEGCSELEMKDVQSWR